MYIYVYIHELTHISIYTHIGTLHSKVLSKVTGVLPRTEVSGEVSGVLPRTEVSGEVSGVLSRTEVLETKKIDTPSHTGTFTRTISIIHLFSYLYKYSHTHR